MQRKKQTEVTMEKINDIKVKSFEELEELGLVELEMRPDFIAENVAQDVTAEKVKEKGLNVLVSRYRLTKSMPFVTATTSTGFLGVVWPTELENRVKNYTITKLYMQLNSVYDTFLKA